MPLMHKPDWEHIQQRYQAWWAGEVLDRCMITVYAPRNVPVDPPPFPEQVEDRWLDYAYLAALNEYRFERTYYGGDAFPMWHPGFPGWSFHGVFLGCPVALAEDTGWWDPIIADGELTDHDYRDLRIDASGASATDVPERIPDSLNRCAATAVIG